MATFKEFEAALKNGDPLPARIVDDIHLYETEYGLTISEYNHSKHMPEGWSTICSCPVDLDLSGIDRAALVNGKIDALQAEKQGLLARTELAVQAINEKIQKLQAIEHKPESAQ